MDSIPALSTIDGKYDLLRRLGEGGMGTVYEARNRGTGRRVAVKVIGGSDGSLGKNKEVIARFQREALATGAIESQYIALVLDTGVDPPTGSPYLVMELLTGEDLEHALKRLGPLPPDLALRVVAQACLGLHKAHEVGVVHRDLKPANIFLATRDGGEIVAKLLDFGIAKVKMEELSGDARGLTRTGTMLGTPLYMSPEQALAKKTIDHRTDLWSIGTVLYEMLSGTTPHAHCETVGELIMSINSVPARPIQELAPWVAPEIAAIVHRALAMDPAARFQSAAEMHAAIAALLPNGHGLNAGMFVPLPANLRSTKAASHAIPSAVRAPAPSSFNRSAAGAQSVPVQSTTAGVASQEPGAPAPTRNRAVIIGVAGVVGAGLAAVIVMMGGKGKDAAPTAASAAPVACVAPPVAAAPPSAPSTAPPSLPVQASAPAAPPPTSAPVTASPGKPRPAAAAQALKSLAQAVASAVTPPPTAAAPSATATAAKPDCNPPYTIDKRGRLHAKPECSPGAAH